MIYAGDKKTDMPAVITRRHVRFFSHDSAVSLSVFRKTDIFLCSQTQPVIPPSIFLRAALLYALLSAPANVAAEAPISAIPAIRYPYASRFVVP